MGEWFQKLADKFYLCFIDDARWTWLVDGLKNTMIITVFALIIGVIIGIIIATVRSTYDKNGEAMKKRYDSDVVPAESVAARVEVATQLKSARLSMNITQQALADRAGTQKSNISRMESGKYNPTLDFIVKVAASMGKEVNIRIS